MERKQISEGVIELRALVGAIYVNDEITQGAFVTSAPSFSNAALDYSRCVRERMPLNLVSAVDLKSMLGLMRSNQWDTYETIWGKLIRSGLEK